MFKPITSRKATQLIIKQIRSAILGGKIAPGEKLPSSSELMDKFGVSKATLREALRALEYLGLIDIRKGAKGGIFAREVDSKVSRNSLINFFYFKSVSVQHLSEVRKILEPYAAKVAAQTISPEGIDGLIKINQRCEAALAKGQHDKVSKDLINFHRVIAQCTENPVLIFILTFVEDLLQETKDRLRPDRRFFEKVIEAHKRIVDAMANRNAESAYEEMYKDVSQVEEYLISIKHYSLLKDTDKPYPVTI
jgi:GntR family transcriptional repressor for pyruvate dehydrogenase complex